MSAKTLRAIATGALSMFAMASAHGIEFFSADRYDEVNVLPVFSLGSPTGMVSSWGSASIAIGGLASETVGGQSRTDASSSISMGLGDPVKNIGATLSLSVGSVNPDGGMAERGSFGAAIGKFFVGPQLGVAVGGIDLGGWNDITEKRDASYYIAATKIFPIDKHPIILSAGLGNNAFTEVLTRIDDRTTNTVTVFPDPATDPEGEIKFFAAAAYYITPHINVIADYTAGIYSVGTSIVPVAEWPLVITVSAYDVKKDVPRTASVSYTGSIAYSFTF